MKIERLAQLHELIIGFFLMRKSMESALCECRDTFPTYESGMHQDTQG